MEKLLIINGSPRAPKSNTLKYIKTFKKNFKYDLKEYNILEKRHNDVCKKISKFDTILFAFPLYVDGLPSILIDFLKVLENYKIKNMNINVLINCGFMEPEQNFVAVDMIKLFCKQNNANFKSCLCIGAGEAIMSTPFAIIAKNNIKKLAKAIEDDKEKFITVTMPISKKMYINASTKYWIEYGKKNNITKEDMERMEIE